MLEREDLFGIVELAFRVYEKQKDNIQEGFITREHIELVTKSLMLTELKNEELNEMWHAVAEYFNRLYCEFDENGNIVGYKPWSKDIDFYRDTKSAWLEVVNMEARKRRENGEVW